MIINGNRALAYIVIVDKITHIDGADNIELATIGGWTVIVKKGEVREGEKAIFFEIDSKVPEGDHRFAFLASKDYKVKTMKLNKFKVWSEGLLLPLSEFPELGDPDVNTDVTSKLGVTYSVASDNERKKNDSTDSKERSVIMRHKRFFKFAPIAALMRYKYSRKIILSIFGLKRKKPYAFPKFVSKTDEERCENMPWILGDGIEYIATEKCDGTSCTYALERIRPKTIFGKDKFEYYVCSRNLRIRDDEQKVYHNKNIYWELENKYNIKERLQEFLNKNPNEDWVCVQGEGVGFVQGNPLKLEEDDLYLFNFITSSRGRIPTLEGKVIAEAWKMKWVPILGIVSIPNTMEELKLLADGNSVINPSVMREGIVYRSVDGKRSFKNVSRLYLLKH